MQEEFLHYLWKYRLIHLPLVTTCGEEVEIIHPGNHNHNAGPDFFNARIKIAQTVWAGNVEIHVKSSDWIKHGHQTDKAYNTTVLHVVYEDDFPIYLHEDEPLPTLEIASKFDSNLYENYINLIKSHLWIPCLSSIARTDSFIINQWLGALVIERLENKVIAYENLLKQNNNNWEESFYQSLAKYFGFGLNGTPFLLMAQTLANGVLAKHKDQLLQIEALLFGQAGMLQGNFADDYPRQLQQEYSFLQKKFHLKPIGGHLWSFFRLRPSNFPTIRIAQFAALIHRSSALFSKIIESGEITGIVHLMDVEASDYWADHYVFDKKSTRKRKKLGESAIRLLIINTVIPFLFLFSQKNAKDAYAEKAIRWLESLPAENNSVIQKFQKAGVSASSASQSQALLHLKSECCDKKRCLDCAIGYALLKM